MTGQPLKQTPSQTLGPYFAYGLTPVQYGYPHGSVASPVLVNDTTEGERIRVVGQVLDGAGQPIEDALIELWQANTHGRYNHPADDRIDNRLDPDFKGFGRCGTGTDPKRRFVFETIKPGAITGVTGEPDQAPHLNLVVMMRGLLLHAFTRIYFEDEAKANASDPILNSVPPDRRPTLIATKEAALSGTVYRFDIHMQGPKETVFFDL